MEGNQQKISAGGVGVSFLFLLNAIVLEQGFVTNEKWYWALTATLPLLILSIIASYKRAS